MIEAYQKSFNSFRTKVIAINNILNKNGLLLFITCYIIVQKILLFKRMK